MRAVLNVLGIVFIPAGIVWILQGLNILTEGRMAGHNEWVPIGSVVIALGAIAIIIANTRFNKNK